MESPSRLTGNCGETLAVASAPVVAPRREWRLGRLPPTARAVRRTSQRRGFSHLSFRVAFSGACLITLDWSSSFRRTPAWISSFFLADLTHILERYGNRGYRAVQLEAGTIGGRMYLAAYAQRLGSTGLPSSTTT
jgi:hypothetical protein